MPNKANRLPRIYYESRQKLVYNNNPEIHRYIIRSTTNEANNLGRFTLAVTTNSNSNS